MSVYRRYFQIKDSATLTKIEEIWTVRDAYNKGLKNIKESIGADQTFTYSRTGLIAGFKFSGTPDLSVFKKVDTGCYYPKKSNKSGKAICAEISKLIPPERIGDALKVSGLFPYFCLAGEGTRMGFRMYSASICGSDKAGWFAVVPWKDEDPAVIEQYKADRDAGIRCCFELDHLLWTPPAEWVEVKEWEVKKAMDEAKVSA